MPKKDLLSSRLDPSLLPSDLWPTKEVHPPIHESSTKNLGNTTSGLTNITGRRTSRIHDKQPRNVPTATRVFDEKTGGGGPLKARRTAAMRGRHGVDLGKKSTLVTGGLDIQTGPMSLDEKDINAPEGEEEELEEGQGSSGLGNVLDITGISLQPAEEEEEWEQEEEGEWGGEEQGEWGEGGQQEGEGEPDWAKGEPYVETEDEPRSGEEYDELLREKAVRGAALEPSGEEETLLRGRGGSVKGQERGEEPSRGTEAVQEAQRVSLGGQEQHRGEEPGETAAAEVRASP